MKFLICFLIQISFAGAALAAPGKVPSKTVDKILAKNWELTVGVNASSFDYKEELEPPLKSTEKATVISPYARARYILPELNKSFLNFEGEISGEVSSHYDGSTMGTPVTPVQDTNYLAFLNLETDFYWHVQAPFYLYVGLGYRHWNRFLSGGSGFREIYTWFYFPIGILYEFQLTPELKGALDFSIRPTFSGKIDVIFSETIENGQDSTLDLGPKTGYKILAPFQYTLNPQMGLILVPWYEYSEIGESPSEYNSTVGAFILEPASKTIQYGLQLGATFRF